MQRLAYFMQEIIFLSKNNYLSLQNKRNNKEYIN